MPLVMSQSGSFSLAFTSIEIQGQWVTSDELLVGSSIQEGFEEGLSLIYFEVLLVGCEQTIGKEEGLERNITP